MWKTVGEHDIHGLKLSLCRILPNYKEKRCLSEKFRRNLMKWTKLTSMMKQANCKTPLGLVIYWKDSENFKKLLSSQLQFIIAKGYELTSAKGWGKRSMGQSLEQTRNNLLVVSQWGHTDSTQFSQQPYVTICVKCWQPKKLTQAVVSRALLGPLNNCPGPVLEACITIWLTLGTQLPDSEVEPRQHGPGPEAYENSYSP